MAVVDDDLANVLDVDGAEMRTNADMALLERSASFDGPALLRWGASHSIA